MPQLDRLLSAVITNKADALTLDEGDPAKMEMQGASRAVTKSPLTAQQVVGLLKEIAPPDAGRQLDTAKSAAFTYTSADGAFAVRAAQEGGKWRARITPGNGVPRAETGSGFDPLAGVQSSVSLFTPAEVPRVPARPTPAATRPAIATPLPNAAMPNVPRPSAPMATVSPMATPSAVPAQTGAALDHVHDFEGSEEARATIEQLLRTTVERGASDLHLRCGEPPIIRLHGEMQRLEGWRALENAHLDSMLRSIMPERNRIEFVHPNKNCIITQRQVGVHTRSFKSALRAALREDPDIVLVGELRDLETVSIAIETAETGHLVFGTLHTTTAPGTIDRIIDQFPADRQEQIRIMLSDSLKGVISQTLCKKIGGGRVAAREILLSIPAVANLIREAKTFQVHSIMQTSRRIGMVTLNDALIEHVDGGRVEPKEAYMKAVDKINFMSMLKQRGHDVTFAETDLASQGQGKANETPASKPALKAAAKR